MDDVKPVRSKKSLQRSMSPRRQITLDLCRGLVRSGLHCAKLLEETIAVFPYESFYAFGRVRADDQARMMVAVEMLDHLGCVVAARVRPLLAGKTDDASGVKMLHLWKSVLHVEKR